MAPPKTSNTTTNATTSASATGTDSAPHERDPSPQPTHANSSVKAKIVPPYKGPLRLNYKISDKKTVLSTIGSFAYCWKRDDGGAWTEIGLLLADGNGFLRNVDSFLRQKMHSYEDTYWLNDRGKVLNFCWDQDTLDKQAPKFMFEQSPVREFLLVFSPVDLLCNESYVNANFKDSTARNYQRQDYYFDDIYKLSEPNSSWLDANSGSSFLFKITPEIINKGICAPPNFIEWLAIVYRCVAENSWNNHSFMKIKSAHLETVQALQYIMAILEVTRDFPLKEESGPDNEESCKQRLDWGIELVDTLGADVVNVCQKNPEYLTEESNYLTKARSLCQTIINVLECKDLSASLKFLYDNKRIDNQPFLDKLGDKAFNRILVAAYCGIAASPCEDLSGGFYKREILPYKIRLAFSLDEGQLDLIRTLLSPSILKNNFPYLDDTIVLKHAAEIESSLTKDIGLEELVATAGELGTKIEPSSICPAGSILSQWAESSLNGYWDNQVGSADGIQVMLAYYDRIGQAQLLREEKRISGKLNYLKYVLGLRVAVKLEGQTELGKLHPKVIAPNPNQSKPVSLPKQASVGAIPPYNRAAHLKEVSSKSKAPGLWKRLIETKDGLNPREPLDNPYLSSIAFSALSIAGGIFGAMETWDKIKKDAKDNKRPDPVDLLKFIKSIAEIGVSITGLGPYEIKRLPILAKIVEHFSSVVEPYAYFIDAYSYCQQCYSAFQKGKTGDAIVKGIMAADYFYLGTVSTGKVLYKAIARRAAKEAVLKTAESLIDIGTGIGFVILVPDLVMTAIDMVYVIEKAVYKPFGAVDTIISQLLDDRWEPKDEDAKRIFQDYESLRGCHSVPIYSSTAGKYEWKQIKDFLLGKTVVGITYPNKLGYRNVKIDEAIHALDKKGIPTKVMCLVTGLDEKLMEEKLEKLHDENRTGLNNAIAIHDHNVETNWLQNNGIKISSM
jgi:hypothetical protein